MKYAVYVLVVEDTEENDLWLRYSLGVEGERVAGNLEYVEARDDIEGIQRDYGNFEVASHE